MNSPARRASTALASLLLASAGVVATGVATPSPAHAAETPVSDATFYWDLNNESTSGAYAPGTWNLFSAGRLGDPGRSTTLNTASNGATWNTTPASPAGWSAQSGNVTVEDLQAGGGYAPATFASTRTSTAGDNANVGNPTLVRGETRLAFAEGEGTLDPDTDSAAIAWVGDATVVYYSGYSFFYLSDPELSIAGGDGTITATLGGYGANMDDPTIWESLPETKVTLATFEGAEVIADGIEATPDYLGVVYDAPAGGTPQTAPGTADHGSFPESFVDFQQRVGTASYWYSSGGGADARKPTNPFSVEVGPQPATPSISIAAPTRRFGQAATATVTVTSAGSTDGTVVLKRGSATVGTAPLTQGRAVFALGKPAAGRHAVTATFSGNGETRTGARSGALSVLRAATSTSVSVQAKPTTRKAGRLRVAVASPTTAPTGKVKVVVKRGARTLRTVTASLRSRAAVVTLPKGAKGARKAVVTYTGNVNVAASSRTAAYRITR